MGGKVIVKVKTNDVVTTTTTPNGTQKRVKGTQKEKRKRKE